MASGILTNRNRLIAGLVILIVLVILMIYSLITFLQRREGQPQVDHRSPVETLGYCSGEQDKLCIVTFSQEVDGGMQVNFQIPNAFFPEFILKISHNEDESIYECERVEATSTTVLCTGEPQVPSEILKFKVFSKNWGTLLAAGNFAIIGIALFTPEVESTATIELPTETPTATAISPLRTPTPVGLTPSPSYPNPSYP